MLQASFSPIELLKVGQRKDWLPSRFYLYSFLIIELFFNVIKFLSFQKLEPSFCILLYLILRGPACCLVILQLVLISSQNLSLK